MIKQFEFLLKEGGPKMLVEALKLYGVAEIVGSRHNKTILDWADAVGIGKLVNDDEQAWCGLFVAYIALKAGKSIPMTEWNILRALQWVAFGVAVKEPMLGDVLIFKREGGGHVGIYVGEDATRYYVLGGNQGNKVSIVPIEKKRLYAARRPIYSVQPANVRKIIVNAGGPVSTNEA
jgi:uncharacterized protein (TIGR02594 family)